MQDYKQEVIEDLKELSTENYDNIKDMDTDELRDEIMDCRFSDSITGNASGSYYCNAYKAQETIAQRSLLFDDYFLSYLEDMGQDLGELVKRGAEVVDVWARCCVLDYMLTDEELEDLREQIA